MGEIFVFSWFGGKKLDELMAIKETEWNKLTEEQRKELDRAIAMQEGN